MQVLGSLLMIVGKKLSTNTQKVATPVISAQAIEQALIRANNEAKALVKH